MWLWRRLYGLWRWCVERLCRLSGLLGLCVGLLLPLYLAAVIVGVPLIGLLHVGGFRPVEENLWIANGRGFGVVGLPLS